MDVEILSKAVGFAVSDKRKSVTYAPAVNHSPDLAPGAAANGFSCAAGAKSMPASRRTSASEHDDELAGHLQGLSLAGDRSKRASPALGNAPHSILTKGSGRYGNNEALRYGTAFNAGMMLDEQLDQEMHSEHYLLSCVPLALTRGALDAMRNLPTSDDDKFHGSYANKVLSMLCIGVNEYLSLLIDVRFVGSARSSPPVSDIPSWFILWSHHGLEREILRVASVQCQSARSGRRSFSR